MVPWKDIRREILERDDFRCVFCGSGGRFSDIILEIDHITPRSAGGGNEPENLRTLCQLCHLIRHGRKPKVLGTFTDRKRRKKKRS